MKRILCFGLLLLTASSLRAQTSVVPGTFNNNVKAGVTTILFGRGDVKGFNYYNEYNRKLNRYFTLAPAVQFGFGSSSRTIYVDTPVTGRAYQDESRISKGSAALDMNLYFSPWKFESSKLRIGVGPSLRYISDSTPRTHLIIFRSGYPNLPGTADYFSAPVLYDRPLNYFTRGYTLLLEGELTLSGRCNLGARASFQNYRSGETALTLGANFGYRF